jgi:glycosyltransferase involved in cell wall biosynthesis
MRILFFTESLILGGKERRLLELIQYLKKNTDYEISLVIAEPIIQYDYAYNLGIPITVIKRAGLKYDPRPFFRLYKFCKRLKPDIIHAWGRMTTFYMLPSKLLLRIPLISSMIADANKKFGFFSIDNVFFSCDLLFSDIILSNSRAGLAAYKVTTPKAKVILNGVRLERFEGLNKTDDIRSEYKISSKYIVIMVAAFTRNKDYDLFLEIAREVDRKRKDVTFIGAGDGPEWMRIKQRTTDEQHTNVLLTGKQDKIERLIAISDIGLLCTYSEGISNSIIECMALGKPVISTDVEGGSREIILDGETGFCMERSAERIAEKIDFLLNEDEIRNRMGNEGRNRIRKSFSITKMGGEFNNLYKEVIYKNNKQKS